MRRRTLLGGGLLAALGASALYVERGNIAGLFPHDAHEDLYSLGVAFSSVPDSLAREVEAHGAASVLHAGNIPGVERTFVLPDSPPLIEGTRTLRTAHGAETLTAITHAFLEKASRPAPTPALTSLDRSALLDIFTLTWALPSPIAALSPNWRYTWPRDTAHVIVALAERGFDDWALGLLEHLARIQRPDGTFEARYRPGTARAPDARSPQFDGIGWFLWAAATLARLGVLSSDASPASSSPTLQRALARSARAAVDATTTASGLPKPSPDYWEVPERRLTLATAAMTLSALDSAAHLSQLGLLEGEAGVGTETFERRARETERALMETFGPGAFQRYARGGGFDAGLLMLLPPYQTQECAERNPAIAGHIDEAFEAMQRPAGGVAPGARWKRDGISWTPQTAMFAQAYARLGERERALETLEWLAAHRTSAGAISEKILADGSPAAVAPLSWPAALALSTLEALHS
ncbi:Glucoamylase and related glycosyl hydrolases [Mycobacteroides abscessus subsp. abscessus]|nr:Glucoamylase and related glycosyl hydrolases [Mycobacteroides abscessus subsp. abscessus]